MRSRTRCALLQSLASDNLRGNGGLRRSSAQKNWLDRLHLCGFDNLLFQSFPISVFSGFLAWRPARNGFEGTRFVWLSSSSMWHMAAVMQPRIYIHIYCNLDSMAMNSFRYCAYWSDSFSSVSQYSETCLESFF